MQLISWLTFDLDCRARTAGSGPHGLQASETDEPTIEAQERTRGESKHGDDTETVKIVTLPHAGH